MHKVVEIKNNENDFDDNNEEDFGENGVDVSGSCRRALLLSIKISIQF